MRTVYFLLGIAFLLTACAAPVVGQPAPTTETVVVSTLPVIPTDTSAPLATEAPTVEPTMTSTQVPLQQWVAFIGNDGNLRLVDRLSGETRVVTSDANAPSGDPGGQIAIQYWDLKASSDGQMLAYRRDVGTPVQDGYTYVFEIWVYMSATAESKLLLANQLTAGMDWKPGTHLLAFAVPPEEGYFTTAELDDSKARGIWAVDADSGENMELVAPQNGYSLSNPSWSPDGRYLAFEEIWGWEGSGYFAFYDFETQKYQSLGKAIGQTDWSPDSQTVAFDMMTYIATGSEQIFLHPLMGGEDQQVAPDYAQGYTYAPHFSPSGAQIAYFFHTGSVDDLTSTVQVQQFEGGEVKDFGEYENPLTLSWLPDESGLLLSVGPYGTRQVLEISLADGSVRVLADGDAPVLLTDTAEPATTGAPTATTEPQWVAFVGNDGNLRLVDRLGGEIRDLTTDGTPASGFTAGETTIQYRSPRWSSDGQFLAYLREVGTPVDSGYSFTYELWVYKVSDDAEWQLSVDQRALGISWRPGTHLLAYAVVYDEGYFPLRGDIDATKAKGIWAVDVDRGEIMELVAPQNGYSLRNPAWSRDGRFLSFEEIWGYEGSGYFAYFDFDTQEYTSFGEAFGFYDWSPDSKTIVHDTLTYTATGTERIFLRPRTGGDSQQISPDYELGYAFSPRFSPSGEYVAFLAEIDAIDSGAYTLFVQPVSGGEPRELGTFEFGIYLSWLPDGSGLILSAGPFETRQVFEVSLADGSLRVLADGDAPALVVPFDTAE